TNFIPVRDFEKVEKPGENIVLYKNEPKKMGKYTVTYVSDTTVAPNTYYKLNFKVINEAGEVKENFDLNPNIQANDKMGLIASPDTKHYLTSDVYTHITSAPATKESDHEPHEGHSDDENYKAPRIVEVKAGDTVHVTGAILTVKSLNASPVVKDIVITKQDLAVGLPLELDQNGKIFTAEPIYLVKGNNTFDFARKLEELGMKFRFTKINPEKGTYELQIYEKPQQAKDWVVFKAIEFPFINLYWAGSIFMVIGFLMSIFRRRKDIKPTA
ncbi:MAG: cytochrome C biogenesis protein, partial [Chitinophagaceae bacterium]